MSHSPSSDRVSVSRDYREGWAAIYNLIEEGESWSGREKNCVYLNLGEGRFADLSAISGLDFPDDGRGAAAVDWDHDGDLDLWLPNRTGPRLRFMQNRGEWPASVAFRLIGTSCNRDALGARLELHLPGGTRTRTVRAGSGFVAQPSRWVHFGLRDTPRIEKLVVHWPGGPTETFTGLEPGGRYRLTQGSGTAERDPPRAPVTLEASVPKPPREGGRARVVMPARCLFPEITYRDFDGEEQPLRARKGRPLLVNLWASWCAPCRGELAEWKEHEEELARAGLDIVALSADEEAKRADARALAERLQLGFPVGVATPRELEVFETLHRTLLANRRPLALPTSFLLDGEGHVAVIYKGTVPASRLIADLALLPLEGAALRRAAIPFPGRWLSPDPHPPLNDVASAFIFFERPDVATEYLKEIIRRDPRDARAHQNLGGLYSQRGDDESAIPLYEKALELDPRSHRAALNLAHAYRRAGRFEEALAGARQALAIEPRLSEARLTEVLVLIRLGRWAQVAQKVGQLRQEHPRELVYLELQARLLAACPRDELRDGARALQIAQALVQERVTLDRIETLAMAAAECRRFPDAVRVQERALELARGEETERAIRKLEKDLALYRAGQPCREPWDPEDPMLSPPLLTAETSQIQQ